MLLLCSNSLKGPLFTESKTQDLTMRCKVLYHLDPVTSLTLSSTAFSFAHSTPAILTFLLDLTYQVCSYLRTFALAVPHVSNAFDISMAHS